MCGTIRVMNHTQAFKEWHAALDARARAAGSNMTQVCKTTGVARVTYERWGTLPPQTIRKMDEIEAEVARLEREAAERPPQPVPATA